MKKIITLAMSAVLTMGLGSNAFAACKNDYSVKYYVPSFGSCNVSGEDLSVSLEKYLASLKNCGYDCDFDFSCINNSRKDCGNNQNPDGGKDNETVKPDNGGKDDSKNDENEDKYDKDENNTATPSDRTKDEAAFAAEVVRLVNEERAAYGLSSLKQNSTVQTAAQVRSYEQVKSFSHTRPDGRSCFTALEEAGVSYSSAGENIAYGQKTPAEVVEAWMNSDGHRANILNKNFTDIGVGCFISPGGTVYWTQLFIR